MFDTNKENHVQALADYLPNGRLFEAKNIADSNFRQLLRGIAGELFTAQGYLNTLEQEYFPDQTTLFIEEWEQALGIPDDCFPGEGTISERRRDILLKLTSLGVQTVDDFYALAAIFGEAVEIYPLINVAFPPYAVPFTPINEQQARFTVVVDGVGTVENFPPYDVPFDLFDDQNVLKCLFDKTIPENCTILYVTSN